ncbi:MAG: condensation domain-containing protein [Blastocatellia bacterium]|nr:condensation domain-containing protein [Blastocatellia bacterium]
MNVDIEAIYTLSPMQEGILFHSLYLSDPGMYFVQKVWRMPGQIDASALKQSWQRVIDRHSVLRTSFVWKNRKKPLQVVHRQVSLPWSQEDLRGLCESDRQERLKQLLKADQEKGFDFAISPLMRFLLLRLEDDLYEFTWSHHHILLDGWSAVIVLNEVYALYQSLSKGREVSLELPRPFRDYIAWLRRQDLSRAGEFWTRYLKGFTRPTMDATGLISREITGVRKKDGLQRVCLSASQSAMLRAFARDNRLTLSTLLQGVWALLLNHYSKEQDVLFGIVVSARPAELEGVESMIGLFINTLPLRVKVNPPMRVTEWLKEIQARQLDAHQFEFSALSDIYRCSEVPRGDPLFESIVVFENYPGVGRSTSEDEGREALSGRAFVKNNYPITVRTIPGAKFPVEIIYDRSRVKDSAVAVMLQTIKTGLQFLFALPCATVQEALDRIAEKEAEHQLMIGKQVEEAGLKRLKNIRRRTVSVQRRSSE